MKVVNLHSAKTHLSRLVEEAAQGEEITIAKAGRPVARLVPLAAPKPRLPGLLRGRIEIANDFDAPLPPDLLELFGGVPTRRVVRKRKPRRARK